MILLKNPIRKRRQTESSMSKKHKNAENSPADTAAENTYDFPSSEQISNELNRIRYQRTSVSTLRSTIFTLIVVAAVAVLVAVLLLPVLRIYGHSMNDTLEEGEVVISVKSNDLHTGDVVAFYYNNKILVKRVIGTSGDWINMDENGEVSVNSVHLEEPYIKQKDFGETNITFPYQVPANRVFVMGDNRAVSIDSRNTAVGCIAEEQIVGKIVFRVWPLEVFGKIQ